MGLIWNDPERSIRCSGVEVQRAEALMIYREQFTVLESEKPSLPYAEQQAAVNRSLETLVHFLQGDPEPSGVILSGPPGCGKTMLSKILARFAAATAGMPASIISCIDMKTDLVGMPSDQLRSAMYYKARANGRMYPMLVLDDMGREGPSAAPNRFASQGNNLLSWIIEERTRFPVFTVITTNLNHEELLKHLGGQREWSRLSLFEFIPLTGLQDYRKDKHHG